MLEYQMYVNLHNCFAISIVEHFESEVIFPTFQCNTYEIHVLSMKLDYLLLYFLDCKMHFPPPKFGRKIGARLIV